MGRVQSILSARGPLDGFYVFAALSKLREREPSREPVPLHRRHERRVRKCVQHKPKLVWDHMKREDSRSLLFCGSREWYSVCNVPIFLGYPCFFKYQYSQRLLIIFCSTCKKRFVLIFSFSLSTFTTLKLLFISFLDHVHKEQIIEFFLGCSKHVRGELLTQFRIFDAIT